MTLKNQILLGGITGAGILIFGAVLVELPLYGYGLLSIMLLLLYSGCQKYTRLLSRIGWEKEQLNRSKTGSDSDAESYVGHRTELLKNCQDQLLNRNTFAEIAAAKEETEIVDSTGSNLIVLGLIGTFYGLMQVVISAGQQMGANAAADISTVLPAIFQNMNGIFASSLSGLATALIINALKDKVQNEQARFLTDLEEYTQFTLIPNATKKETNPLQSPIDALRIEMQKFRTEFSEEVISKFARVGDTLTEGLLGFPSKIEDSLKDSQMIWQKSWQTVLEDYSGEFQNLLKTSQDELKHNSLGMWKQVQDDINAGVKSSLDVQKEVIVDSISGWANSLAKVEEGFQSIPKQTKVILEDFSEALKSPIANLEGSIASLPKEIKEWKSLVLEQQEKYVSDLAEKNTELILDLSQQSNSLLKGFEGATLNMQKGVDKLNHEGVTQITEQFSTIAKIAEKGLASSANMEEKVRQRIESLTLSLEDASGSMSSTSDLMKVNQVEFQSSLEMFNSGVESLIEHLQNEGAEDQDEFLRKLNATLGAFHEKASDVLVENSVRTQEILLEVLQKGHA
jgi:hypothetical protein